METRIRNVSLSFCCKKDWNAFQSVDERNRFCSSCEHNVIDFTKSTQAELDNALKAGERVCGRFTAAQLSDKFLKYVASTAMTAASILSTGCAGTSEIRPSNVEPEEIETIEEIEYVTMGIIAPPSDTIVIVDSLRSTTSHKLSE